MPEVSVIVPNYNHARFLRDRLDSILNQTFQDFELIILDDASTDNSENLINKYKNKYSEKIKYIPSAINSGSPYYQWDKGINSAKAEFIWIAESDDVASNNFLELLLPVIKSNERAGIVVAKSDAINENSNQISKTHPVFEGYQEKLFPDNKDIKQFSGNYFIKDYLIERCLIPNVSGIIFRKSVYLKAGKINTSFKRSGDYDLYIRMLKISDIIFVNKTLNSTRYHTDKLTISNTRQSFKERYLILKNLFKEYKPDSEKRYKISQFYFTVFKHDLFIRKGTGIKDIILTYIELTKLDKRVHLMFFKLLFQRIKISLAKFIS